MKKHFGILAILGFLLALPQSLRAQTATLNTSLFELATSRAERVKARVLACANTYNRARLSYQYGSSPPSGAVVLPTFNEEAGTAGSIQCRYNDSGYRDYFYDAFLACTENISNLAAYRGFGATCKNPGNFDATDGAWSSTIYFVSRQSPQRSNYLTQFPDSSKDIICIGQNSFEREGQIARFTGEELIKFQHDCRQSIGLE